MRHLFPFVVAAVLALGLGCGGASTTGASTPPGSASPGTPPDANMDRSQIPARYRWRITPLFATDAAFDEALQRTEAQRRALAGCQGSLSNPARLAECLGGYLETRLLTNQLTLYANLQQATDTSSSDVQARADRSQRSMAELMALAATWRNEILAYDDAALAAAVQAQPQLAPYRPYIDQIRRRREHVLDTNAERILSLAGDNQWAEIDLNEIPSDHERTFQAFLSQLPMPTITDDEGNEVQLTLSSYGSYRGSSDRRVRRDTVERFFATLRSFDQTFAALLTGQARETVFLARSRGYETALDAYLHRDDIDPVIYRTLVSTVEDNLEPLHRYMRFRREQMGVEELHVYDLYTPIVPTVERRIPYDDATRIVTAALAPLGDEYLGVLREGLEPENGWIDVYPHAGKESGAFSASIYGTHPFVLMNYFEQLGDMMTLAHEYGHALHSHLAMESQPYVTSSYVPMIAETASTVNEVLVIRHLIANASDDAERLYLLGELVEMIRTTIYRQALFASFELAVHAAVEAGTPTTAEFLNQLYAGLIRRYYGEALTVGENDGMEWAYVPHFYYKFYVYSYAVGLSSGIALSDGMLAGGEAERDAYLGMLRAGNSSPPLDLLRGAGVDPSSPTAVTAAARLMDESLAQMEAILARQGS